MRKPTIITLLALVGPIALAIVALSWQQPGAVNAASASAVVAGGGHTCALTTGGGVQCWGYNAYGQLGNGTTADSATPVAVSGLASGVVAISAGGYHTCAITSGGGAKCWGRNDFGQLGDGTATNRTTPVDVSGLGAGAASISAGGLHTCAVTSGGGAKCWGRNDAGQLGDGTGADRATPVDVSGLTSGVGQVSAGGSDSLGGHTCALTTGGGVKCWGRNDFGQLGNGTTTGTNTPVDVTNLTSGAASVAAGRYHSCARTSSNSVKCWGWNIGGQLGDGTFNSSSTPVDVINKTGIAAQLSVGGVHSCVATTANGARCWGFNNVGQLGNGTAGGTSNQPVDVLTSLGGPPLPNVLAVAAGGNVTNGGYTCALLLDGTIMCWGENGAGQLGDGSTTNRVLPVDVVGFDVPDATATPVPTDTPLPNATATPVPTDTPTPTNTPPPTVTNTPNPTATPYPGTPAPAEIWDQLDDLHETVEALDLPNGTENALLAKLENAQKLLREGKPCAAKNVLRAFINQVEALKRSRRISEDAAMDLIEQARAIIETLRAEGNCRR